MEQEATLERVDKIVADIAEILERATPDVVEKLKTFVDLEPNENQLYATIELFSDQNFCITYNRFYGKEVDGKKTLDTEYDVNDSSAESLIPELDAYETKMFDGVEYSIAEQQNFGPRQSKMLFEWFAKCWKAAGGEHSKTPTFFAMNKEYMCQDLSTGEMYTEEEAAQKLGYEVQE